MNVQDNVKRYYGETLKSSNDLKTDACCTPDDQPEFLKDLLANIHDDVKQRYYGCGLIAPLGLKGTRVLDLGCGAGMDVYALAQLVGPEGEVVGVDMTAEQLAVARKHNAWHAEQFGYPKSNVSFVEGYLEKLDVLNFSPESFDVIISNCVINLCTDKMTVFQSIQKLLKPGGEFYFSDVYADRRLPQAVRLDPVLYGECLGGALYWNDFLLMAKEAGFFDPRTVTSRSLEIHNPELKKRLGAAQFYSSTFRLFRIDDLEATRENYGQMVTFKGGLEHADAQFVLDQHNKIDARRKFPVCGNTWRILNQSRFAPYFEFIGDFDTHYGRYPEGEPSKPFETAKNIESNKSTCC